MIPFFDGLGKKIVDISPSDIQQYFVNKLNDGLSPNTIVKHQTILRGVFCYAVQQGLIPFNPLDRVLAPKKVESVVKYFTNGQLELILSKVSGTVIEPAVYIAIYCGFRRGEVLGVKWKAVDFAKGIITMSHPKITKESAEMMLELDAEDTDIDDGIPDLSDYIQMVQDQQINEEDYIESVLSELSEEKRRLYTLYYLNKESMREIALLFGVEEAAMRMRFVRLRREIRTIAAAVAVKYFIS